MASNVTVAYLADVTDLRTKSALAKSALSDVNAAVREQAAAFRDASDEAKGPALAALQSLTAEQKELQAQVSKTTAEIRKSAQASEEHTGALNKLHESVKLTGESFESMSASVRVWTGAASAIGEFALASLGLERAAEAVNKFAEGAEAMKKLSDATGLTTGNLYALKDVAALTSTPFETVQADLTKLVRAMEQAAASADSGPGRAFHAMGISVTDASGRLRPMGDILDAVALKMSTYASGSDKAALELQLFGRTGTDLNAVLNELAKDGLDGATQRAYDLGTALGPKAIAEATEYEEHVHELTLAWQGFANVVMSAVLPSLNKLTSALGGTLDEDIENTRGALEQLQANPNHFDNFVSGLLGTTSAVDTLRNHLADLLAQKSKIDQDKMVRDVTVLGTTKTPAPGSQQAPAFSDKGAGQTQVEQWKTQLLQMETAEGQFHQLSAAQEAKFWQDKLALTKGGTADQREVMQEFVSASQRAASQGARESKKSLEEQWHDYSATMEEEIAEAKGSYAQQTALAQAWVARGKTLFGEHVADYKAASDKLLEIAHAQSAEQIEIERQDAELQKQLTEINSKGRPGEFKVGVDLVLNPSRLAADVDAQIKAATDGAQAELKILAEEMQQALTEGNQPAYNQAFDESIATQARLAQQIVDINTKAAEATQASWQKITGPIDSAFGSIVGAAINGGVNSRQAMERAAVGVVQSWAKSALEMTVHWVTMELTQTAATTAGVAARTSATVAGAAAGKAAETAAGATTVMAAAGKAAAGAYASVAQIPYVGWLLAPAAAVAAFGAVAAYESVASAEGGWDRVPYDGAPAVLHKNEMVLPASLAQNVRDMAGMRGVSLASAGTGLGGINSVNNRTGDVTANFSQTNHIHTGADSASVRSEMARASKDAHQQMVDYYGNTGHLTLPGRQVRK